MWLRLPRRVSASTGADGGTAELVLPRRSVTPGRGIIIRIIVGIAVLFLVAVLVYLGRDGYTDVDDEVSFRDALYYATVSLSTTGYGDIAPVSREARLVNILLITPLRVVFVLVLVATTIEVLTQRSRDEFRISRWRAALADHIVVVGYGTKGRAAARAIVSAGRAHKDIVVVEPRTGQADEALADGFAVVAGDGTRDDVMLDAGIATAAVVVVAVGDDAAAVLSTLTARRLNRGVRVVAAARDDSHRLLLHDGGADNVVLSSETAGRLLAMRLEAPATGAVLDDLMSPGDGLDLIERTVSDEEVGCRACEVEPGVVAVVHAGQTVLRAAAVGHTLAAGDRIISLTQSRPHDARRRSGR